MNSKAPTTIMASTVDVCPAHFLALAVPGAIAGDYLVGSGEDILLGGLVSAVTGDYVQVNEGGTMGAARKLFRTAPLLGLGAGYTAGRLGGLVPAQALVPGVLGAFLAVMMYRKSSNLKLKGPNVGEKATDVAAYQAIPSDGSPPPAPGSIFPFLN